MVHERLIRRYRCWYAKLLRLYPRPYRERFGEGMEQTFGDILRERSVEARGLFGPALWMCAETSAGIIRENITFITMQKGIIRVALGTALVLMIPLVAMQFTNEVNWDETDFLVMGALLFGTGLTYELLARKMKDTTHRMILGIVLLGALLLIWADLAVGIFNIPGISGS